MSKQIHIAKGNEFSMEIPKGTYTLIGKGEYKLYNEYSSGASSARNAFLLLLVSLLGWWFANRVNFDSEAGLITIQNFGTFNALQTFWFIFFPLYAFVILFTLANRTEMEAMANPMVYYFSYYMLGLGCALIFLGLSAVGLYNFISSNIPRIDYLYSDLFVDFLLVGIILNTVYSLTQYFLARREKEKMGKSFTMAYLISLVIEFAAEIFIFAVIITPIYDSIFY